MITLKKLKFTEKNCLQLLFILLIGASSLITNCDSAHDQLRLNLEQGPINQQGIIQDPSIQILKSEEEGTRLGVCHNYAISKTLNLEGLIPETMPIVGAQDWHEVYKFTENYCEEVSKSESQPGDLVTYHNDSNCPMIEHTGLVHGDNMVESKWGTIPHILIHPTFTLPSTYGNHIRYHRPIKASDEIIRDMNNKIAHCGYAKRECIRMNKDLVYHAEIGDNFKTWDIGHRCMCASVESTNADKQTVLMIAAKNNNIELAKMLTLYKADINKQDINGKTAMHLAAENDNLSIIPILLEYPGCNKNIKDNLGNEAFDYCYEYQNLNPVQYALKRCAKPTKMAEKAFWRTMNS